MFEAINMILNNTYEIESTVNPILKKKYNITLEDFLILQYISKEEETSIKNIQKKIKHRSSNLSVRINHLKKMNYIYKERRSIDERIVFIRLTDTGKKIVDEYSGDNIWNIIQKQYISDFLELRQFI
ncbi:transcriptional regulator [Macrococcus capreoli]